MLGLVLLDETNGDRIVLCLDSPKRLKLVYWFHKYEKTESIMLVGFLDKVRYRDSNFTVVKDLFQSFFGYWTEFAWS